MIELFYVELREKKMNECQGTEEGGGQEGFPEVMVSELHLGGWVKIMSTC